MKFSAVTAALVLLTVSYAGCGITNECTNGAGEGGGGEGTGTDHLGPVPDPGDGPPVPIGFGQKGIPCGPDARLAERATAEETEQSGPHLASIPTKAPFDGWVMSVSVVHAIDDVAGVCGTSPRRVFVSNPVKDSLPVSPGIHEIIEWSTDDIGSAEYYLPQNPDKPAANEKYYVILRRDLLTPFHAYAGEYVHLGSLLDDPSICQLACEASQDGSPAPEGHAYCGKGNSWSGCAAHPFPGSTPLAYVGWVDFVEDAQ